jgi:hypothetical protein
MQEPISITEAQVCVNMFIDIFIRTSGIQLAKLRQQTTKSGGQLERYRPVQPLNDRVILYRPGDPIVSLALSHLLDRWCLFLILSTILMRQYY